MAGLLRWLGRKVVNKLYQEQMTFRDIHPTRDRVTAAAKIGLQRLFLEYQVLAHRGDFLPRVGDTGFRVFSEFDEDGILLFLLAVAGVGPRTFVDIGGGDGITGSNCANLAIHLGFHGVFIDGNEEKILKGRNYYQNHPDTFLYPPRFVATLLKRDTVNQVIEEAGYRGEVSVLSIDIDGNDYWMWDAIDVISPRIVVIETHVEFGEHPVVVPYDENYVFPGKHPDYHGASPVAMARLGQKKGYRLVGCNRYGFNTFYLRKDLAPDQVPEMDPKEVLRHVRNRDRVKRFEAVKDFEFLRV